MRTIKAASLGSKGGRPTGLVLCVHVRFTNSRCQRKSVPGVTMKEDQRSRGSRRDNAVRNTLSLRRSLGRPAFRLRTVSSWRRTSQHESQEEIDKGEEHGAMLQRRCSEGESQ